VAVERDTRGTTRPGRGARWASHPARQLVPAPRRWQRDPRSGTRRRSRSWDRSSRDGTHRPTPGTPPGPNAGPRDDGQPRAGARASGRGRRLAPEGSGTWAARSRPLRSKMRRRRQWRVWRPVGPSGESYQAERNVARHRAVGSRAHGFQTPHAATLRSLSAFPTTETELKLMAAAAIIGLSSRPKKG
jgi:hypothetical protein